MRRYYRIRDPENNGISGDKNKWGSHIWTEDIFKKQNEYFLDIGIGFTVWLNEVIFQRRYLIPNNYNNASGLGNTEEYNGVEEQNG